jgi:pyridoxamine 5'-phosphate oxidase
MTDDELLQRFEAGRLESFRHADHLRVAWRCLALDGAGPAVTRLSDGLQRFAAAKGVPEKFHVTMTRAWVALLDEARRTRPDLAAAGDAVRVWPALAEPHLVRRFYTAATLDSDDARRGWVPPDRAPLALSPDRPLPHDDPFAEFDAAIARARAVDIDTTPMTLATAGRDGRPSARIVLLRGADARGFVFYTNYTSRKGRELRENPFAALCFHWPSLEEQIRIEGPAGRVDPAESDAYFAARPRGHQIGAWASLQSQPLEGRTVLEARAAEIEARYRDQPVPRPPHWGGFRVVPDRIEFWKGRPDRLHDRVVYTREAGGWTIQLLFP